MKRLFLFLGAALPIAAGITFTLQAAAPLLPPPRPTAKPGPRLIPVAETKLLMEGLAQANFQGLEKLLKDKPTDLEAWTFARGQAILIAETGNLLMLRPPRGPGEKLWMDRAGELRGTATDLAKLLASRDYEKSRKTLTLLANRCNACHQSFKVKTRIAAFAEIEDK